MAAIFRVLDDEHRRIFRRERVFRDINNPLDYLNDIELISRYRLPRDFLFVLIEQIRPDLERICRRSHALTPKTQVLATVRYLAKRSFISEVGDLHGGSKASISRSVDLVTRVINRKLNNIKFPTDFTATKHQFYSIANLPNVIGAVDGTLIPILAPYQNETDYVCRKGYHAMNVQVVADASLRFTNVVCKWPGSVHDSFIFNNSCHKDYLEAGGLWIPTKRYLLTPKPNPSNREEENYNSAHARTRSVVERALGVCKSRFRSIHKTGGALMFSPSKCVQLITSIMILHNMCIERNVPVISFEEDQNEEDIPMIVNENQDRSGLLTRQIVINRFR